jgi:hypothetical protein
MVYSRTVEEEQKLNGKRWPEILDWLKVSLDESSKELAKQNQYKDITIETIFIDPRLEQALEPNGSSPHPNTLGTSNIPMGPSNHITTTTLSTGAKGPIGPPPPATSSISTGPTGPKPR